MGISTFEAKASDSEKGKVDSVDSQEHDSHRLDDAVSLKDGHHMGVAGRCRIIDVMVNFNAINRVIKLHLDNSLIDSAGYQ